MYSTIHMPNSEKPLRHEKNYRYVSSHDVTYWARSFTQDLERACIDHHNKNCWGLGLGLGFRVLSLSHSFEKLSTDYIVSEYEKSNKRAIFLDYDGTLVPQCAIIKKPSLDLINVLSTLSNDPKNTVFIVSGRGRSSLREWLAPCEKLGLAAEHGYFIRWNMSLEWESTVGADLEWKQIVEPVMRQYTEATDGSSIENKESALVWHYQDADPDFGSCQVKELMQHLENVLANESVAVKRGQYIVEVKPQVQLKEIWEQIDGMRAIVGYKATPQQTCIEELEALYMFTGIEPPPSFKDPSDLADISSKLRFLMSIVGVK